MLAWGESEGSPEPIPEEGIMRLIFLALNVAALCAGLLLLAPAPAVGDHDSTSPQGGQDPQRSLSTHPGSSGYSQGATLVAAPPTQPFRSPTFFPLAAPANPPTGKLQHVS